MIREHPFEGIVFDLDGVLADSKQAVNQSWEAWSRLHGVDVRRAIQTGHGRTTIEALRVLVPDGDLQASFEQMEQLEQSLLESVVPVAGAAQFVCRLIEMSAPWAVATSSTRRIAIPRLKRCGIPSPRVLIAAEDVTQGKPDPQPYAKAIAALGVDRRRCLVFEDAPSGILSAIRAGAKAIAVGSHQAFTIDAVPDFRCVDAARVSAGFVLRINCAEERSVSGAASERERPGLGNVV